MNLINDICTELRANGVEAQQARLDKQPNGIVIRQVSSAIAESYMDGTREMNIGYQVIVRNRIEQEAKAQAWAAYDVLRDFNNGTDYQLREHEVIAPVEILSGETGLYAYGIRADANIMTTN